MSYEFIILFTAILIAIKTSFLGSVLVLKKSSMLSDAISHSVLPGIVISYLWLGNDASITSLLLASLVGVISVLLIEMITKSKGVKKDSVIGLVYTFMFSIGVILISLFAKNADIDLDCVLFGDLSFLPFTEGFQTKYGNIPNATILITVLFFVVVTLMYLGKKSFLLIGFDEVLAKNLGFKVFFWNLVMLSMISITTVFAFQSVGAIMVISLLVIPPGFAQQFAKRIPSFILISISFSITNVILGYYISLLLNINSIATISVLMGIVLIITILFKKYFSKTELLESKKVV